MKENEIQDKTFSPLLLLRGKLYGGAQSYFKWKSWERGRVEGEEEGDGGKGNCFSGGEKVGNRGGGVGIWCKTKWCAQPAFPSFLCRLGCAPPPLTSPCPELVKPKHITDLSYCPCFNHTLELFMKLLLIVSMGMEFHDCVNQTEKMNVWPIECFWKCRVLLFYGVFNYMYAKGHENDLETFCNICGRKCHYILTSYSS